MAVHFHPGDKVGGAAYAKAKPEEAKKVQEKKEETAGDKFLAKIQSDSILKAVYAGERAPIYRWNARMKSAYTLHEKSKDAEKDYAKALFIVKDALEELGYDVYNRKAYAEWRGLKVDENDPTISEHWLRSFQLLVGITSGRETGFIGEKTLKAIQEALKVEEGGWEKKVAAMYLPYKTDPALAKEAISLMKVNSGNHDVRTMSEKGKKNIQIAFAALGVLPREGKIHEDELIAAFYVLQLRADISDVKYKGAVVGDPTWGALRKALQVVAENEGKGKDEEKDWRKELGTK